MSCKPRDLARKIGRRSAQRKTPGRDDGCLPEKCLSEGSLKRRPCSVCATVASRTRVLTPRQGEARATSTFRRRGHACQPRAYYEMSERARRARGRATSLKRRPNRLQRTGVRHGGSRESIATAVWKGNEGCSSSRMLIGAKSQQTRRYGWHVLLPIGVRLQRRITEWNVAIFTLMPGPQICRSCHSNVRDESGW